MLHKKSWQDIRFILLASVVVLVLSIVLVARFQRGNISPSTETDRGAVQQIDKAESIAPTDKTELPQTETIAQKPLPAAADPGYLAACQKLKETYVAEYNAKHADENKRHVDAQQSIINKYSAAGMSFSLKQKTAHSAEVKRHDSFQKQLEAQHQKQLAELRC